MFLLHRLNRTMHVKCLAKHLINASSNYYYDKGTREHNIFGEFQVVSHIRTTAVCLQEEDNKVVPKKKASQRNLLGKLSGGPRARMMPLNEPKRCSATSSPAYIADKLVGLTSLLVPTCRAQPILL